MENVGYIKFLNKTKDGMLVLKWTIDFVNVVDVYFRYKEWGIIF